MGISTNGGTPKWMVYEDILIRMDDLRDLGAPAILRIFMVICPACEFLPGLLIHAAKGPFMPHVATVTNGGWRVSLVMCLPAGGIITDLSKRRFNIFILLVTLTHLLLVSIAHFSAPGSLPSATNRIGSGVRDAPAPDLRPIALHWHSAELVPLGMLSKEKNDNYIPTWDGSSRTWRRYCKEVAWYMSGTKANQRQYAAAKLITRLTGAARLLSMSWHNWLRGWTRCFKDATLFCCLSLT